MKVLFIGPVGNYKIHDGGYGNAASGMYYMLNKMQKEGMIESLELCSTLTGGYIHPKSTEYDLSITMAHPSSFLNKNTSYNFAQIYSVCKRNYLSVVWETEPMPESWDFLWNSDMFTGFLTPSFFIMNQIKKKTEKPIYYYPHFINKDIFPQINIEDKIEEEFFKVLFIGQYTARKGMEDAVVGYSRALGDKKDCKLILKYHTMSNKEIHPEDFIKYLNRCNVTHHLTNTIYALDSFLEADELAKLYRESSLLLMCSRGEGFGLPCHPENMRVYTSEGYKNISNIKENDKVLSHNNIFQEVTGVTKRYYEGDMIKIQARGCSPIELTPNHKVLIYKTNKKLTYLRKKSTFDFIWEEASQLKNTDFLTIPKLKVKKENNTIKISDYVSGLEFDKNNNIKFPMSFIKNERGVSYSSIAKHFGCRTGTVHKALHKLRNSKLMTDIQQYCEEKNYVVPNNIFIKDEIFLSEDIMRLFGFYLAEGSSGSGGNSVEFSFHAKEKEYHEFVKRTLKKIFPSSKISIFVKGNKGRVIISSKIAASFFNNLFGKGSRNKRIPECILNSTNANYLLRGHFDGDGNYTQCEKKGGDLSATTYSYQLAHDISLLFSRYNIFCSISTAKRDKNEHTILIYKQFYDRFFNLFNLDFKKFIPKSNRLAQYVLEDENYFLVPIKKIEKYQFNDYVYNMHVDEDESYTVERISSHNCAEAQLAGIPVTYTNWSSLPEVCEAEGNYPIDYFLDEAVNMAHHGYEKNSKYAKPSISSMMTNLTQAYTFWKEDRKGYYESVKQNRQAIIDKFGEVKIKGYLMDIIKGE